MYAYIYIYIYIYICAREDVRACLLAACRFDDDCVLKCFWFGVALLRATQIGAYDDRA